MKVSTSIKLFSALYSLPVMVSSIAVAAFFSRILHTDDFVFGVAVGFGAYLTYQYNLRVVQWMKVEYLAVAVAKLIATTKDTPDE